MARELSPFVEPSLPALRADAAEKQTEALSSDPLVVVRSALDTTYEPTRDVRIIILIPSLVIRPYVYFYEHDDQMVFLYPVAQRFVGSIGVGPPDRLVRLAAALGDHGRLRILAALKEGDMTVKELGDALHVPRSTLRHHIAILRSAGLLRPMQTAGGLSRYQVREEAATDLAELLNAFLHDA
jgi:DNA-binding transcriptional ArsR family regulator